MPTKSTPNTYRSGIVIRESMYRNHYDGKDTFSYYTGSNTITYGTARREPNGHWPWNPCEHTEVNHLQPWCGSGSYSFYEIWRGQRLNSWVRWTNAEGFGGQELPQVSGEWDRSVVKGLTDQVDLNVSDSVLLYANVIQAVPLVGTALKLSSVLNAAGRRISKQLRKQPFTTVVKSLIQADFIDRFVISPMINDAVKFANAVNYVLNVIRTANERNMHRFALSSSVTDKREHSELTWTDSGSWTIVRHSETNIDVTSKAFALLEARYDINAVDPIKLWANRVGLTRPLDSVWDLVPFSFVVDYFTRAGDFISHLSDEMSKIGGLQGKITNVLGLWGTYYARNERSFGNLSAVYNDWIDTALDKQFNFAPGTAVLRTSVFRRFPIPDAYSTLLQFQDMPEDYLTINLDLSSTRKRTLAELVIQAKL